MKHFIFFFFFLIIVLSYQDKKVSGYVLFGSPLSTQAMYVLPEGEGTVPRFLVDACEVLSLHLHTEGLFRKPGSMVRVKALKARLEAGENCLPTAFPSDVAALVKQFFRDLPERVIRLELLDPLCRAQQLPEESERISTTTLITFLLPQINLDTLKYFCAFLRLLASRSEDNKMDTRNLALVFTPTLFPGWEGTKRLTVSTEKSLHLQAGVVQTLITHATEIGRAPRFLLAKVPPPLDCEGGCQTPSNTAEDIVNGALNRLKTSHTPTAATITASTPRFSQRSAVSGAVTPVARTPSSAKRKASVDSSQGAEFTAKKRKSSSGSDPSGESSFVTMDSPSKGISAKTPSKESVGSGVCTTGPSSNQTDQSQSTRPTNVESGLNGSVSCPTLAGRYERTRALHGRLRGESSTPDSKFGERTKLIDEGPFTVEESSPQGRGDLLKQEKGAAIKDCLLSNPALLHTANASSGHGCRSLRRSLSLPEGFLDQCQDELVETRPSTEMEDQVNPSAPSLCSSEGVNPVGMDAGFLSIVGTVQASSTPSHCKVQPSSMKEHRKPNVNSASIRGLPVVTVTLASEERARSCKASCFENPETENAGSYLDPTGEERESQINNETTLTASTEPLGTKGVEASRMSIADRIRKLNKLSSKHLSQKCSNSRSPMDFLRASLHQSINPFNTKVTRQDENKPFGLRRRGARRFMRSLSHESTLAVHSATDQRQMTSTVSGEGGGTTTEPPVESSQCQRPTSPSQREAKTHKKSVKANGHLILTSRKLVALNSFASQDGKQDLVDSPALEDGTIWESLEAPVSSFELQSSVDDGDWFHVIWPSITRESVVQQFVEGGRRDYRGSPRCPLSAIKLMTAKGSSDV
nr:PREDICTED: rho GTPase-activating protein 11A-like isoform X2 [Latimeria chalumnae]|eukprot:XP_005987943.1 PREDICTED: rho GTPase-activating protein 11A-like isoform X2 [Latimeria chalumnae]